MKNDQAIGAKYYKCALQVNSYQYNHKYRNAPLSDERQYNEEILRLCKEVGIEVVGLAEHGNVNLTESLRRLLESNGIIVFPGFELCSTEKIHIVCLFPSDKTNEWLNQMLGNLQGAPVTPDRETDESSLGYCEIAQKVMEGNGITYAAHVEEDNGLLKGGFQHIWKEEKLVLAVQINKDNVNNLDQKYSQILKNKTPDYKRIRPVAIINAKDVEQPMTLQHELASCWIKMDHPSIEGLRQAFLDGESRIRLNSQKEETKHSQIINVDLRSLFFEDNLNLHFNPNLNTLIGGRGTGKSTLLECIRYGLDINYNSEDSKKRAGELLKKNFADGKIVIRLFSSRYGKNYTVERFYGQPPVVKNEDGSISNLSTNDILPEMKVFGQNEIFEFSEKIENHSKLIEKFIPEEQSLIPPIVQKLKENRNRLVRAREQMDDLEQRNNRESKLKERLQALKALGLDTKFQEQNTYHREQQLLKRSDNEFTESKRLLAEYEGYLNAIDLHYLSKSGTQEFINKELFNELYTEWQSFQQAIIKIIKEIHNAEGEFQKAVGKVSGSWKQKQAAFQDDFEKLIRKLPDSGGRKASEIAVEFNQISRELAAMQGIALDKERQQKSLDEIMKERKASLAEMDNAIDKRYEQLVKVAKNINKNLLKGKLEVSVQKHGILSPLKSFLIRQEGIGERRTSWLDDLEDFNMRQFAEDVKSGDVEELTRKYNMTKGVAETLSHLSYNGLYELEEIVLPEKVVLKLNVGTLENPDYKEINQLSSGQKCTAILNILLISSKDTLIIDQPEDNLDNAFIADNIVSELRSQKEKRQFIFSTHNANIPVFGDAEWIGVMVNKEGKGSLPESSIGSIDNVALRPHIEDILEGGKYAFETRRLKYNY